MLLVALALASEVRVVPAWEVQFVEYVSPDWPESDRNSTRTCRAEIDFDETGAVTAVEVGGLSCPESYRTAARAAMERWRVEPHLVDEVAVPIRVEASVTFKPAPKPVVPAGPSLREDPVRAWWRTGAVPPDTLGQAGTAYDWDVLVRFPAVPPRYPRQAREAGFQGECFVRLWVDTDGRPYGAVVGECPDVFVEPTLGAAQRWRLASPVIDGIPQRSVVQVRVEYKL